MTVKFSKFKKAISLNPDLTFHERKKEKIGHALLYTVNEKKRGLEWYF